MNLNINEYTIEDLFSLYNISDPKTPEKVQNKTNEFVTRYQDQNVKNFFYEANTKLLNTLETSNTAYEKIIYINSKYRKNSVYDGNYADIPAGNTNYLETDYTFNLSESMKNVESLELISIEIPYTWYNIDEQYFNNFFWLTIDEDETLVTIPSGNYTIDTLINKIREMMGEGDITYDSTSKKTKITSNSDSNRVITFHKQNITFRNYNLGWILGFRDVSYNIPINGVTAEAILNITNIQYFILLIDDYNNSKVSKNLLTMYDEETSIEIPEYFSNDLETSEIIEIPNTRLVPQYGQGVPRILTEKQQYTLNESLFYRQKKYEKLKFMINSDVLAIIPVNTNNLSFAESTFYYVDSNVTTRKYFGKVNIDRMRVRLINDRGQLVNLNGADWSFTLKSIHS
tara:strand:- start:778 stop:1977 length:1200 start_codon:yes stop_codon:yes gene_type:complete